MPPPVVLHAGKEKVGDTDCARGVRCQQRDPNLEQPLPNVQAIEDQPILLSEKDGQRHHIHRCGGVQRKGNVQFQTGRKEDQRSQPKHQQVSDRLLHVRRRQRPLFQGETVFRNEH